MWAYTIQQYALDDTCVDTNNHLDRYSSDRACTWSATVSMGYLLLQQLFSHGGYDIVAMGCDATQYTYTFPANRVAELDKLEDLNVIGLLLIKDCLLKTSV